MRQQTSNLLQPRTHDSVSQGRWLLCEEKIHYEATEGSWRLKSFSWSQDISTISSSHYLNRKAARHCRVVQYKEECPPHRIEYTLEIKPEWGTQAEEKPIWDTTWRLRGKWVGYVIGFLLMVFVVVFQDTQSFRFFQKIRITGHSLKVASYHVQTTVQ